MHEKLGVALEGRYTIDRELGAGGMATVFLANDLRHERRVAIKVLKPELAAVIGAERFLREIKTIASLQHPHILGLIDSGEVNGTAYYVMPYIDGESLRDRIEREKQLPVSDVVRLSSEVASALDYAHRHGVIHRDVKPENILLHDGRALVADFGIALAVSKAGGTRMTETGMSLGTPQYMSPEQAMGEREIGPRSDVYSLGAVTYEMLAGEPPFTGPTAQAIVARIVTEEPRSLALRRHTIPTEVESAVLTALEKLPADRFASTREFAEALASPDYTRPRSVTGSSPALKMRRWKVATIAASIAAVAAGSAAFAAWLRSDPPRPVMRYAIAFPDSAIPNAGMMLTRDGSRLIYARTDATGKTRLWVKERDRYEPSLLPGTENVEAFTVSPDGQWVAMVQNAQLTKLAIAGGSPIRIADSVFFGGVAWLDDGTLVYTSKGFALMRISADGGKATILRPADGMRAPVLMAGLPAGRGVLFTLCSAGCTSSDLYALDLKSDTVTKLVAGTIQGWYLPTGHLVYVGHDRQMFVVRFDLNGLEVRGTPVPVLSGVSLIADVVPFVTISWSGTLIMQTGQPGGAAAENFRLVWVDRTGKRTLVDSSWSFRLAQPEANHGWSLSPDGKRLVINLTTNSGDDIWTKVLPRGPVSRLTFDSASEYRPRWTPDGQTVTYIRRSGGPVASGAFLESRADGTGTVQTLVPNRVFEGFRTKDGWIIARVGGEAGGSARDIVGMRIGADSILRPLVANPNYNEAAPVLSPDGRWLAYESDETGRLEVYIRPFPNTESGKWQVSENGGQAPLWAHSGRELFFVDGGRNMVVASVTGGNSPGLSARRSLFPMGGDLYLSSTELYTPFDISADDMRFIMVSQSLSANSSGETFVLADNWFEEVRSRLKSTR
jgi:eukaryotic-like serine/threonine-protein kinase